MSQRLEGKVAIVTGGASGIGRSAVLRFIEEGAAVLVADLNAGNGAALVDEVGALGHQDQVRFLRVDVADEEQVAGMVGHAVEAFGRLDVMFNNAGIGGAYGAVTDIYVEDWDFTFAVLVRGTFLGVKHAARQLSRQGVGGSIVNTASIAAFSGGAGPLCYSAAKAAVLNLTRSAAVELAPDRIRVNAICPGPILTPLLHQGRPEQTTERMGEFIPWPEIGRPEHVAEAALWFASDESDFVTGDAMVVDGGVLAAGPGIEVRGGRRTAPPGRVGLNQGTTGEAAIQRNVPAAEP